MLQEVRPLYTLTKRLVLTFKLRNATVALFEIACKLLVFGLLGAFELLVLALKLPDALLLRLLYLALVADGAKETLGIEVFVGITL